MIEKRGPTVGAADERVKIMPVRPRVEQLGVDSQDKWQCQQKRGYRLRDPGKRKYPKLWKNFVSGFPDLHLDGINPGLRRFFSGQLFDKRLHIW